MFTDIVGYSAMMGNDESKTLGLLKQNRVIHKKTTRKYKGRILKEMGDGMLVSFPTISEAVYCAGGILQETKNVEDLNLRIGIHQGEIVVDGREIYGDGVNMASRIEGLADDNQILISETVYRNVRNNDGFTCAYLGEHQLKNISGPIKLYSVDIRDYPREVNLHKSKRNSIIIGASVFLLIIIASIMWFLNDSKPVVTQTAQIIPLTSSTSKMQLNPTFSPDGSGYAYSSFHEENTDIMITSRGASRARNLTNTPQYDENIPAYSPDGTKIAFLRLSGSGVDLFWISPSGGAPKRLVSTGLHIMEQVGEVFFGFSNAPWSPDSKSILYPRLNDSGGISVWEVNVQTGDTRQVTYPEPGTLDLSASYNRDGSEILFLRNYTIWITDNNGNERPLIHDKATLYLNPTFNPEGNVIFSSRPLSGSFNVWEFRREENQFTQITNTNNQSWYPITTPNNSIAWEEFHHQTDLIYLDLETNESVQLTSHIDDNFHPSVSPDGKKIVYHSSRTGNNEIWILTIETGEEYLVSESPYLDMYPDWSPEGDKVIFFSNRTGEFHMWIADTIGTPPVQLTREPVSFSIYMYDYAMELSWSPDGKKIGYIANSELGRSIWIMDPDGTNTELVIGPAHSFDWYLDSRSIVYNRIHRSEKEAAGLRIRNIVTGEDSLIYEGRLTEIFVHPDGNYIGYAYDSVSHHNQSLYLMLNNGSNVYSDNPVRITNGHGLWHAHMASWCPDGKSIVYVKDTDRGNIMELSYK
jgi:Tol biopolymer transport system component